MPSADETNDIAQALREIRESLENPDLADASDSGGSAVPIGQVEVLGGDVEVTRADGDKVSLSVGDSIYEGDTLETGADGSVGVVFSDGGSFSLGENGRMTLDEMTFDSATSSGEAVLSVVEGVFSYVSGQIAKFAPDAMTIATPSANIGIRGTAFAGNVDENGQLTAALMEENGGFTGELIFTNSAGVQIINQPGLAVTVTSETAAPSRPFAMSAQEIGHEFARAIHSLPGLSTHLPSDVRDAVDEAVSSHREMTGVEEVFDGSVLAGDSGEDILDGDPDGLHDGSFEPGEFQPFGDARDFNPLGLEMGNSPPIHLMDTTHLSPLELMALRERVERFIENEADDGISYNTITSASVMGSLIFGKGGGDGITGSSSGDILYGGDNVNGDSDVLRGDDGNDTLVINGNAVLAGGDLYSGGQGYDALKLLAADDYGLTTISIAGIENLVVEGSGSTVQASNPFLGNLDSVNASTSITGVTLAAAADGGNTLNMSAVTLQTGLISTLTFMPGGLDSGVTILDSSLDTGGRALLGGADTLIGEDGADVLTGGAGFDVFTYTASTNGGGAVDQADSIMDFTAGEDSFLLEAAGFGSISTLSNGYNYTEIAWFGGDLAALNVALADGTIEALMTAAGIGGAIDCIAFLSFTDNSGGEDTAQYLLYDNDVSALDGVTVLADMNATTAADISDADFTIS